MPTRDDLKRLARLRLQEAEALYDAKLYDGCVYTAGYVVELALKARICKLLGISEYPDGSKTQQVRNCYHTHDLKRLRYLAGLVSSLAGTDPALASNWSLIEKWTPEQRYEPPGRFTQKAASDVLNALRDRPYGVLTWISKRW